MTDQIIFNKRQFTTKRAATTALRAFVATLPLRLWIARSDSRFVALRDAIAQHPSWGSVSDQIVALRAERERGGGLALVAKLKDGTTDKIGWTRCFTTPRTPRTRLMNALRFEIQPQITEFRKLVEVGDIPQVSAISGERLVMSGQHRFHVDHTPAFADTVEEWAPRWGGLSEIKVVDLVGGGTEIERNDIADDWWNFHLARHNRHNGLRAIIREENLALGRHNGEV